MTKPRGTGSFGSSSPHAANAHYARLISPGSWLVSFSAVANGSSKMTQVERRKRARSGHAALRRALHMASSRARRSRPYPDLQTDHVRCVAASPDLPSVATCNRVRQAKVGRACATTVGGIQLDGEAVRDHRFFRQPRRLFSRSQSSFKWPQLKQRAPLQGPMDPQKPQ